MYRDLIERGYTDTTIINNFTFAEPVRLFLRKKDKRTIFMNHEKREVPVLVLEGEYVKDAGETIKPETYPNIRVMDNGRERTINHFTIIDDPKFPYKIGNHWVRIQTRLPVQISMSPVLRLLMLQSRSLRTANVYQLVPGQTARPTCRFSNRPSVNFGCVLPLKGSKSGQMSFNDDSNIPLKVTMKRKPRNLGDEMLWITKDNLDSQLGKLEGLKHTAAHLRKTLKADPKLKIMIPRKPVPTLRTGAGLVYVRSRKRAHHGRHPRHAAWIDTADPGDGVAFEWLPALVGVCRRSPRSDEPGDLPRANL